MGDNILNAISSGRTYDRPFAVTCWLDDQNSLKYDFNSIRYLLWNVVNVQLKAKFSNYNAAFFANLAEFSDTYIHWTINTKHTGSSMVTGITLKSTNEWSVV